MNFPCMAERIPAFADAETRYEGRRFMTDDVAVSRLRWVCSQRSMHEMDVILGQFMEMRFSSIFRRPR